MAWLLRHCSAVDWEEVASIVAGYWNAREESGWLGGMECTADTPALDSILWDHGYRGEYVAGYYVTADGMFHSHDWLVLDGKIIDVTHAQFGAPNWLITDAPDPRYRAELTDAEEERMFQQHSP